MVAVVLAPFVAATAAISVLSTGMLHFGGAERRMKTILATASTIVLPMRGRKLLLLEKEGRCYISNNSSRLATSRV